MADPRLERPFWRGRTNIDAFTIAWILHAEDIVRERWPKLAHPLVITKGGYQPSTDPDSADTHTKGGGTDFTWCHPECLLALRLAGGFAWHRTPAQGDWADHIHGAPIGHPLMAPGLARQEISYVARRNGLKNNGPDDGPRLDPIPRPVWPWPQEDLVTPEDIDKVAAAVLARPMKVKRPGAKEAATLSVEQVLRETFQRAERIDEDVIAQRVAAALLNEPGDIAATVDADQIAAAVKQALREGTGD